jgi:hypothetical protein
MRDLTMPVNLLDEAPLLLYMSGPYLVESVLVTISASQLSQDAEGWVISERRKREIGASAVLGLLPVLR